MATKKRKPKKRGPVPERLKITLPPEEAMRRLLRPKRPPATERSR